MTKILSNDKPHYLPSVYINAIESSKLNQQDKKLLKSLVSNLRKEIPIASLAKQSNLQEQATWKTVIPRLEKRGFIVKNEKTITLNIEKLDSLVAAVASQQQK